MPFGVAGYEATNFILKVLYVFTDLASPNLAMLLFGIKYAHGGSSDGMRSALTPLATLMYALRFIQWWQEQAVNMNIVNGQYSSPPPPAPTDFPPGDSDEKVKQLQNAECPICKGVLKRPVALPTGRIFCGDCLVNEKIFQDDGKCPVTKVSVTKDGARPIYVVDH